MSIFKQSIFAAVAFFSITGQANASIISYNFGAPLAGSLLETFDELPLGGTGIFSLPAIGSQLTLINADIVQGTTGIHAAPYIGVPDPTQYVSLYTNSSATFSFSNPSNYFGMEWGSVDTYNTLSFYNNNTLLGTIVGQTIISAANLQTGNQGPTGTVYANFNSTLAFNKVIASSTNIAYEFDNIRVSSVPLPAGLPMFGAAIIVLGAMRLRSRKGFAKVTA